MSDDKTTTMTGVREYAEGYDVELVELPMTATFGSPVSARPGGGRLVVRAWNEGHYNLTEIDLLDLVAWMKANRPDLLA